ncbi:MAG: S9 family peptidase, partial [Bacteroidetes bacterium]|nr:S9 family peptidase [Bacteroidota bacterium]
MKTTYTNLLFIAFILGFAQCKSPDVKLCYPVTKKGTQSDNYFGTNISDPYRWLENDTSAETKDWVKTEQAFTEDYLSKIPFRQKIMDRYKELLNYDKYFGAFKVGEYIIYSKQEGLQNQSVYYIQNGLEGEPKVLIDPNKLSDDGSVSVSLDGVSNDKKYIAYHVNKGGSDWQTMYIMEIATQKKLDDQLEWLKFGGAAWHGSGFYYSRYDQPAAGTELSAKSEFQKIFYHKLGDKQEQDLLVFEDKAHPQMYYSPAVTEDERYLFIYKSPGTDGTEIIYRNLTNGQKDFKLLLKGYEFNYSVINNIGDQVLVNTNDGAGNYMVVQVDPNNPQKKNWKQIIPEKPEKLESASMLGGKLFISYLKDASTRIYQYKPDGTFEHEVLLPAIGSASGIGGFNSDTFA